MSAQAHVEQVEVFGAFGGEARADRQRDDVAHGAEVKGQRAVVLREGEGAVAVAARVFLKGETSTRLRHKETLKSAAFCTTAFMTSCFIFFITFLLYIS